MPTRKEKVSSLDVIVERIENVRTDISNLSDTFKEHIRQYDHRLERNDERILNISNKVIGLEGSVSVIVTEVKEHKGRIKKTENFQLKTAGALVLLAVLLEIIIKLL